MNLLCTNIIEGGGDGEGVGSKPSSLLSYTLRFISHTDLDYVSSGSDNRCTDLDRHGESVDSEELSLVSYTL